ncbi:hypothetical protein CBF31_09395 [Vagococcus fessus]|uniref:Uncharacterized protein n=2 Tax=Vagococcus fessus TaxID=120370 RepID=A0A430A5E3_9ENTE|nr:hypothetical protein CBF31_09395 [Vagococcus fessus]
MLKIESKDIVTKFKEIYVDDVLVIGLSIEVDSSRKVTNGVNRIVYDEDLYLENKEDIRVEMNKFQSEAFLLEDTNQLNKQKDEATK